MTRTIAVFTAAAFTAAISILGASPAHAGPTFSSCKQAKAAGYCDIPQGSPQYSDELDRDQDGIACEC